MTDKTVEQQNQIQYDTYIERGPVPLGPWTSHMYRSDPRHLLFVLSRYKFCAKMLTGKKNVLEIGCGDAFGTPLVLQSVESIHGIDIEPLIIKDNNKRAGSESHIFERCEFSIHDITAGALEQKYAAAFSLDVIEHIPQALEHDFMRNITLSLSDPDAICIIGTPNLDAAQHASSASRDGHVNLKNESTLRSLMTGYFNNVLLFSMNDEIVHTGFYQMAHYIFAVGVGIKGIGNKYK